MLDRDLREQLVDVLLASHVDGGNTKVRFISAVNDYEKTTNKSEKANKARKIISTFIQKDATFSIATLSLDYDVDVNANGELVLFHARSQVTFELLSSPIVLDFLRSLEKKETQPEQEMSNHSTLSTTESGPKSRNDRK
jgi:hypothetical protein